MWPVRLGPEARSSVFTKSPQVSIETGQESAGSELLLVIVVLVALAFDFTNGFHDTANAMATSIATGALEPRVAVAISAVGNLAGAFISIKVAATIATDIVDTKAITQALACGLEPR